jgi:ABC-type glycerol-3-phosphate transport system permease component
MSVVRKGPKATAVKIGTYILLIVVAVIVLFPFLVGFTIAFKEPKDVFNYPPTLIPQAEATGTVAGVEEPVPLYSFPGRDGTFGLVENGVSLGVFVDPADPAAGTITVAGADAERTEETVIIDGDERPVFVVTVDGEQRELARLRTAVGARFVNVGDDADTYLGLVSDGVPAKEFNPRFANFGDVLERQNLNRSLTNTFLVTVLVVTGQVVTSVLGGYAFARMRFRGRDSLFLVYLGSVMIPFVVLIIPLYQLMVALGWVDNMAALIIPFVFTAYGTFLMRQFFIGIPPEIEEAALLDGASRAKILWRIFVPLARPAIATLATFAFLYAWNSFVWPLVVINSGSTDNFVLSLALQQLGGRAADSVNLVFAGIVIAMIPPITVFLLAQRHYVENAAGAGMK